MCSPGEVVLGSQDPGSGGLHRLPGCVCVCVDSDLCLHTGFLVAAGAALAFHAYLCGQADSCGLHLSLELV